MYKEEIEPIVKKLCELDKGNKEANFGQMKEFVYDLASLIKEDPSILEKLKKYSENI